MCPSSLEIRYCWEDEHLLEVEVITTDGVFSGRTKIYVTYEQLLQMGHRLIGFPSQTSDRYYQTYGEKGGYSFLGLEIFTHNSLGHLAVHISLEADDKSRIITDKHNKIEIVFETEANAINRSARELIAFGNKSRKSAVLTGIK